MTFRTMLFASALLVAAPVAAREVTATNPKEIAELMQSMGYRAELKQTSDGDPMIDSSAAGVNFSVYFYDCKKGMNCGAIQFSSGFDLEAGTTLDVINEWNAKKRFGKAYLDDTNDPFVEIDVNMYGEGISETTFKDIVSTWDDVLADFQKHIDW